MLIAGILLMVADPTFPGEAPNGVAVASGLKVIKTRTPEDLRELFRYSGEPMHFVSAHRGGPKAGCPENCIATFENTLEKTFAVMEIDPRYTKDGAIVVHHDPTLDRTTTGEGLLSDMTLSQLRELRLKDPDGQVTDFQIPTLDEVLEWARGKTILVIDQKDVPLEARIRKIEQHHAEAFAVLIVYSFRDARRCYTLNTNIMMEVMIPNRRKFHEFGETKVPWHNIIAFIGHTPPQDDELANMIHAKGTCCIVGTSRNLDRELILENANGSESIERSYRRLLEHGADIIETDLPREVGQLLYAHSDVPASKSRFFGTQGIGGHVPSQR
jgi:glycerophosphoryl diester phosphodiesterase